MEQRVLKQPGVSRKGTDYPEIFSTTEIFLPSHTVPINTAPGQTAWFKNKVDQQQPLFQNGQTNAEIIFLKKRQQNKSSVHSENTHCCSLTVLKPGGNHALFLTHPKPSLLTPHCWLSVPQQQLHSESHSISTMGSTSHSAHSAGIRCVLHRKP